MCPSGLSAGGEPTHHCVVPSGQSLNETIPLELKDNKWRYSQCSRYVNLSVGNDTTPCDEGWYYDRSEFKSTIVSDVSNFQPIPLTQLITLQTTLENSNITFLFFLRILLTSCKQVMRIIAGYWPSYLRGYFDGVRLLSPAPIGRRH